MDIVLKDNRARENGQLATNKQIKLIQEGLTRFIETCNPVHPTPLRTLVQPCAPKMSTPITPSGAPTRYRSELSFTSPVNQTTLVQPTRGDGGRNLNQQPTHEDGNRNGNSIQQPTMNENYTSSGLNNPTTQQHVIRQAIKCQYLMEQYRHNFAPGSYSLRPSRATNAGRREKKWYAWWHRSQVRQRTC